MLVAGVAIHSIAPRYFPLTSLKLQFSKEYLIGVVSFIASEYRVFELLCVINRFSVAVDNPVNELSIKMALV